MPKFSVCLIARNEAKTLPRLMGSLSDFLARGGEVVLVDTGSTDGTPEVARSLGCKVYEVGNRFQITIGADTAKQINEKFVFKGDPEILKGGDVLFDFSSARNYAASLASNDMLAMPDCDEAYTKLNIDLIDKLIDDGFEQFEYNFVFSHDAFGNESIKFLHSKFYDRRKLKWTGIIHEVLTGNAKRIALNEEGIKLEHWQNHGTDRSGYLRGLALDCFQNPSNDRHLHYFGRELFWSGRPASAVNVLKQHIAVGQWPPEKSQSMVFIGDACRALGSDDQAVAWYHKAFVADGSRREPLMRLAEFFFEKNDPQKVACYATAALEIPANNFYANNQDHYRHLPHELLYWAYWNLGMRERSRQHFELAFLSLPHNQKYLYDVRFYRDLPKVSIILPTMHTRPEGEKRVLASIEALNYPKELIETLVIEDIPRQGVPKRVAEGLKRATGSHIVFASDDIEFEPNSVIEAVLASYQHALVAFNTGPIGPDEGNICEHFMIRKDFVPKIGDEIFDTDFHHVGVDNLLWAKAKKLGQAHREEHAKVTHHHFSKKDGIMDSTYQLGWQEVEADRALLVKKLSALNG